jgi:hypothetical protein
MKMIAELYLDNALPADHHPKTVHPANPSQLD